jgi:hypothetical protein
MRKSAKVEGQEILHTADSPTGYLRCEAVAARRGDKNKRINKLYRREIMNVHRLAARNMAER